MTWYFPSARSRFLGFIVLGMLAAALGLTVYELIKDFNMVNLLINSLLFIVVFSFVGIIYFKTGYYISNGHLIIKLGPITYSRILITDIKELKRSYNLLGSPAISLKRLAIRYGQKGFVLISPKDEADFISVITRENPDISVKI